MSETTEDARICTHGSGNRMTCQLCILEVFQMRTPAEFASAIASARAQLAEAQADLAAVRKVRDDFKEKSDVAYCLFIDRLSRSDCLGVEAKMADGTFALRNLLAHKDAERALGEHRALADAYKALGRALAAQEGA